MVVFEHEFPEFEDVCLHCGITATQYEKNTDGFRCVGRNVIPPREPRTCLAADDVDVISTRLAELQAERDAMLQKSDDIVGFVLIRFLHTPTNSGRPKILA